MRVSPIVLAGGNTHEHQIPFFDLRISQNMTDRCAEKDIFRIAAPACIRVAPKQAQFAKFHIVM